MTDMLARPLRGTPLPEPEERVRERIVKMLSEPNTWPMWPKLPLKRRFTEDGSNWIQLETGYSVTADFPLIVLKGFPTAAGIIAQLRFESTDEELAALGFFDPRTVIPEAARKSYEEQVVRRYATPDQLLADGWVID